MQAQRQRTAGRESSGQKTPERKAPGRIFSAQGAPEKEIPGRESSGQETPERETFGPNVPEQETPERQALGQSVSEQKMPEGEVPGRKAAALTDAQYAQRLAKMLQCRTVSQPERYDDTEFAKLRGVMHELFPLVHARCTRMTFGDDCWVYRLAGRDEARNVMLMSHHDVAAAGDGWTREPFSGEAADGRIWGRGAVDTKTPLFAEFSALEELLADGWTPPCNVWLASSHNEEQGGNGIPLALEYFQKTGVAFEVVLDEGGAVIEPPLGGMRCEKCAMVAVHEKGRYRVHFAAEADGANGLGGAVKTPPAVRMAAVIGEASAGKLFVRRMNPQVKAMLQALAPHCTLLLRAVLGNLWLFGGLLTRLLPRLSAQAGGLLGSTCDFSRIEGDTKRCTAEAMLRSVDAADLRRDLAALRALARRHGVEMTIDARSEYHGPADITQPAYARLLHCIAECFPAFPAVPFILPAGTDARVLTEICPCVLRFAPLVLSAQQLASVHGADENIDLSAPGQAVRFYKRFLERCACAAKAS